MGTIDNTLNSRQFFLESELLKIFNDCKEGNSTMKSSFLVSLGILLVSSSAAFAQSTAMMMAQTPAANKPSIQALKRAEVKKKAPKSAATTVVEPATKLVEKSSFDKFFDRLRISTFSVVTTPTFYDMEKGNWDNAAISPEFGGGPGQQTDKNQDTWPTNLWNQVSFNYNFGAKMNFVFNPRFMIPLSHSSDMKAPEDRSLIALEDFLVGFQGVVLASSDKKFNLWIRPGVRLPTSRASRNSNNGGFGRTTHQLELAYLPTYDFNKKWQVGIFGQVRQWVFEDRYNWSRLRFYTAPYVQYAVDDTTRIQVYYENMYENFRRWESINGKKPVFKDMWQSVMVGVNKDITPKLNIFPYVTTFVNDVPYSTKSFFLGAWISYQIK